MKKYFRVAIRDTVPCLFYDLEVGGDVSLPNFWTNIRMASCLISENFCVPYDMIAHISVVTVEQAQVFKPHLVN